MVVICTCFFFWFEEKLKAASAAAASTLSWRHGRDSGILQRALQVCQKFVFLLISTTEIYNEDCPGIGYTCMALVKHAFSLYTWNNFHRKIVRWRPIHTHEPIKLSTLDIITIVVKSAEQLDCNILKWQHTHGSKR
jgi:hypothetical protein